LAQTGKDDTFTHHPFGPIGPEIPESMNNEEDTIHAVEDKEQELPGSGPNVCQSKILGLDTMKD